MRKTKLLVFGLVILSSLLNFTTLYGQNIFGTIISEKDSLAIKYVNIGVTNKNIGTVSDYEGKFSLPIKALFDKDTLKFSCIGYLPLSLSVKKLREKEEGNVIILKENTIELDEVIINSKEFKQKNLGISTKSKKIAAGFKENLLGYELGVLMKTKKTVHIKTININIAKCSYDSIYYRINIYKVRGKKQFENILTKPIYIQMSKEEVRDEIHIDLESQNIIVDGNFLVSLEQVKNLGKGYLYFCAGLLKRTFYRKTSQAEWQTAPIGISINVDVGMEE